METSVNNKRKAFTSLDQSRKLAEILPPESADMFWREVSYGFYHIEAEIPKGWYNEPPKGIPCWSLAALIEQIPSDLGSAALAVEKDDSELLKYGLNYHDRWGREDDIQTKYYDNLVDACVEMIIKLNKQKLL